MDTPSTPILLQALLRILSAVKRVRCSVTPCFPGNKALLCVNLGLYSAIIAFKAGWILTIRVLRFPLVVDLRKVIDPHFISVVRKAKASEMRQPVNKQIANNCCELQT